MDTMINQLVRLPGGFKGDTCQHSAKKDGIYKVIDYDVHRNVHCKILSITKSATSGKVF